MHRTLQAAGPFSLQGVSTVCQLYIQENKIRKRHIAYCICQPVWALAWDIQLTVTVKSQNDWGHHSCRLSTVGFLFYAQISSYFIFASTYKIWNWKILSCYQVTESCIPCSHHFSPIPCCQQGLLSACRIPQVFEGQSINSFTSECTTYKASLWHSQLQSMWQTKVKGSPC